MTPQEQLRLVDYDGMYVPAVRGLPSNELGHSNYQHPLRSAADFDENLDSFSALVIYTALRALIAEPGLWGKFDTGENLLFSATDFKSPGHSPLFQQLRRSPDPAVKTLADRIARACDGTPAGTPDFKRLVDTLPPILEPEPWWHGAAQSRKTEPSPPIVPPLPSNSHPATKEAREREDASDPDLPWWSKRPSALISEFHTPDWLAPSALATLAVSRIQALQFRQVARKSFGCIGAAIASCTVGLMLWIGLGLALRYLFQRLFGQPVPP